MIKKYFALVILCGVFVWPFFPLSAHTTGSSWENDVNGYKLDIGYDPTTIVAGQPVQLDFDAYDLNKNSQDVDFTDVWLRVSDSDQTIFASGIHKLQYGVTAAVFTFPKAGTYDMYVRFEKNDTTVVEETLPVTVAAANDAAHPSPQPQSREILLPEIIAALSLVAGFLVGYYTKRRFLK